MVAEFAPVKRRGFFASLPASGVFIGIGLAAAVSAVVALLPEDQLITWGWRVPFLFSILVVAIGLLIRLRVPESPVFTELKQARARTRVPALALIKAMPRRLLLVMVANGVLAFNIYVVQTYSLSYIAAKGVAKSVALSRSWSAARWARSRSRCSGHCPTGRVEGRCTSASAPSARWWPSRSSGSSTPGRHAHLLAFALALGGCLAMFGSQAAYYAELFPAEYRFSGFALGREIPGAVLAGPAPVISVGLVSLGAGSPTLLAIAMVVVALAGLFAVVALPETRGVDLAPIVDPDQIPGKPAPPTAAATREGRPIATA